MIEYREVRTADMSPSELRNLADALRRQLGRAIVVASSTHGGKAHFAIAVGPTDASYYA